MNYTQEAPGRSLGMASMPRNDGLASVLDRIVAKLGNIEQMVNEARNKTGVPSSAEPSEKVDKISQVNNHALAATCDQLANRIQEKLSELNQWL